MDRRYLLKAGAAGSAVLAAPFVITRADDRTACAWPDQLARR